MAGLLGPNADAESLVLGLLNRQDRYLARRTCHVRRRELGARTTTLVLSEDEAGKAVLPSVDLASSFPSVRTLVLRCKEGLAEEGWPGRFSAFVSRNAAALQQLRHLDLGYRDGAGAAPLTSIAMAALAQLPGLQSLHARVDRELSPPCWAALGSLEQLTGLRLDLLAVAHKEYLQHIVDAAPQLQELWLVWFGLTSPEQLACLTGLRSLSSLQLWVDAEAAEVRSLTALLGLTHLALGGDQSVLAAVGQLTGLVSLEMFVLQIDMPLQPLAALQQLTSLALKDCVMDEQQVQVLAGLGQLRHLEAYFDNPAAAAAAGVARLEVCKVLFDKEAPQGEAPVKAPGHLRTYSACLAGFDLSSVLTLQLEEYQHAQDKGEALRQQLPRCPHLRALDLNKVPCQPEALQAIAALPQLQHLCLSDINSQMDCGRLAVLAGGSRQLRQLALEGVANLPESTLVALMVGLPQLRLLRLLGCSVALSQECCQALVGQLQLYRLQADVVVDDGSGRAGWMIKRLARRWMEA
jgi:hypothetical protein